MAASCSHTPHRCAKPFQSWLDAEPPLSNFHIQTNPYSSGWSWDASSDHPRPPCPESSHRASQQHTTHPAFSKCLLWVCPVCSLKIWMVFKFFFEPITVPQRCRQQIVINCFIIIPSNKMFIILILEDWHEKLRLPNAWGRVTHRGLSILKKLPIH